MFQRKTETRKIGAIFPSTKSAKSTILTKTKKKKTRRLYYIPELDPATKSDKHADFACALRGPYITFTRSDAKKPPTRKGHDSLEPPEVFPDGTVNYWYILPADSPQVLWWKRKIGTWLAQKGMKFDDAR